jgi:hypothetical protein
MAKYYQISVSQLVDTFSRIESGIAFDFIINTSEIVLSDLTITKGDVLIASINDNVYYNFHVVGKTTNELQLKKSFEIKKTINHSISEIGVFEEISESEYNSICSQLFSDYSNVISQTEKKVDLGNIKEEFANWLFNLGKYSRVYKGERSILIEKLNEYEIAYNNDFGILIFGYPSVSLETIISELESNKIEDTGEIGDLNKRTVGNGSVKAILGTNNYIKFLKEILIKSKIASAKSPKVDPINKIYFGAPGTGKSFRITEALKEVDTIFQKRITFHPEYDNASFIGGYKPITNSKGDINYEFVPQIFTNIYVEACNDPDHQYYLIIEEINRGNCAEIFGELFQLLDRDDKYKITPSNELIIYLNNNIKDSRFYVDCEMLLPDNLSIYATMNTSDQSLFPMDSAFKRRWDWEYIPICYTDKDEFENDNKSFNYEIDIEDGQKYSWIKFIEKINLKHIKVNPSLGMDKCIGNYFIKPDNGNVISLKPFVNKIIFYLWNDVFKDEDYKEVFGENISYEDFFPIEKNGRNKIKELFNRIRMEPKNPSTYQVEEIQLGQVAEPQQELDSE